ncbi:MAG TPA: hypothetical protein VKO18_21400 [Terriglobia bacterium]|nr:hypothetical protein [Terriglobia bacterium]
MVKSLHTKTLCILGAFALVISVITGTLPAQQPASSGLSQHIDPQARRMLDRAIQAMGGQAFLNATSLTTKGRAFFFQDGATAGMEPFESNVLYPDKRRFSYGKTKPVLLINSGDKGWELDRYGLIAQPDQQLQAWITSNRYNLENLLRLRINEPGVLIQIGKVDFVDNAATQGIEIIASGGTSVRLDLHRQTSVPTRITYRVRNVKEEAWDDYSDAYADYKTIDGIQTPMHITRYLNGDRIGETFRNAAKYNEEYPPNYFTPE